MLKPLLAHSKRSLLSNYGMDENQIILICVKSAAKPLYLSNIDMTQKSTVVELNVYWSVMTPTLKAIDATTDQLSRLSALTMLDFLRVMKAMTHHYQNPCQRQITRRYYQISLTQRPIYQSPIPRNIMILIWIPKIDHAHWHRQPTVTMTSI